MESINKVIIQFSAFENACPYTIDQLREGGRKRNMVYWRQVGQWWYFLECGVKSHAGRFFDRDHATVIHSIRAVNEAIEGYNPELLRMIEDVISCAPLKESKYMFVPHESMCVNEAISLTLLDNYK
jgi:hypothetical protein